MEKRTNTRVVFEVGALVKYGKKSIKCKVLNLSLHGILLKTDEDIPLSSELKIGIFMEGTTSHLQINLDGIVVRSDVPEIGVEFKSIDLDSFIHLKNIVAYNEGDADKIMREFYKR